MGIKWFLLELGFIIVWTNLMRSILFCVYLSCFMQLSKVKFILEVDECVIAKQVRFRTFFLSETSQTVQVSLR